MSFVSFSSWLTTNISALPTVAQVSDFVSENSDDYPLVVNQALSNESDPTRGTNQRNRRDYNFELTLYCLINVKGRTRSEQEILFLTALDEITDFFDDPANWHISGDQKTKVHLQSVNISNIQDTSPKKKAVFTIKIYKLNG